jgi:rhodanese-related sulfurtransferase
MSNGQQKVLSTVKGSYVLLSFWASFDAPSRLRNVSLSNELKRHPQNSVKMVSVSFDTYNSIFEETVRKDRVDAPICVVDTRGKRSAVYKKYRLNRGFNNYLLNEKGVIIAKNLSPDDLSDYLPPAR